MHQLDNKVFDIIDARCNHEVQRHDDGRRPSRLCERARQAFSIQPLYYAQTPLDTAVGLTVASPSAVYTPGGVLFVTRLPYTFNGTSTLSTGVLPY